MGHSQTEKTRNHDRIVEVAARRIREAGTEAPGVAEIMAARRPHPRRLLQALRVPRRADRRSGRAHAMRSPSARCRRCIDGAERPAGGVRRLVPLVRASRRPGFGLQRRRARERRRRAPPTQSASAYTAQVRRYLSPPRRAARAPTGTALRRRDRGAVDARRRRARRPRGRRPGAVRADPARRAGGADRLTPAATPQSPRRRIAWVSCQNSGRAPSPMAATWPAPEPCCAPPASRARTSASRSSPSPTPTPSSSPATRT